MLCILKSMLVASALLYYHWEAMLVSYLSNRRVNMPFTTLSDMYLNTDYRIVTRPSSSGEDDFKFSTDPIWKKIYEERLKPYLSEYIGDAEHRLDIIRKEYTSAAYTPIASTR